MPYSRAEAINSKHLKGCSREGLSSAHQIRTLKSVEVELSLRKRTKDKILSLRSN